MKSIFKYASALLLGAAGMYICIESYKDIIPEDRHAELLKKELFVEWAKHTPQGIAINQRNFLSDILRNHIDSGCPTIKDDVNFWLGMPPYEGHDFKMRRICPINGLKDWGLVY